LAHEQGHKTRNFYGEEQQVFLKETDHAKGLVTSQQRRKEKKRAKVGTSNSCQRGSKSFRNKRARRRKVFSPSTVGKLPERGIRSESLDKTSGR